MIVIDASALVHVLVRDERAEPLQRRLRGEGRLNAPHLIDVEVLSALRRSLRLGLISVAHAESARRELSRLRLVKHGHETVLARAWQLHDDLSAYDAVYVALAERLRAPLVTSDARLARAPGLRTKVEVYE